MADLKIKIKGDASGLKRGLNQARATIGKFASYGKMAMGAMVGAFGVLAAKAFRIKFAFEQTEISFSVMLGTMEKGKKLLDELTEFSVKTPFQPKEVQDAAKTLLAFGVQAKDIIDTIKTLGDISSGTGKDLSDLAQIYGKVFVKGKIQAEELNQLSEAGVPIIKELQKLYGATASKIFKMGSQGKLSFEDMSKAMALMTSDGGMFFRMMDRQSATANGKISTLKGNFDELGKSLTRSSFIKSLITDLNDFLVALTDVSSALFQINDTKQFNMMDVIGYASRPGRAGILNITPESLDPTLSQKLGKSQIDRARLARDKRLKGDKEEADRKKAESAARLKARFGERSSASMMVSRGMPNLDKFLAAGSDIIGGGYGGISISQQQLNKLTEMNDNIKRMNQILQETGGYRTLEYWKLQGNKFQERG